MKPNSDREWLKKQAALEDNCFVSVGGLVLAVEDLEQQTQRVNAARQAFVSLVNLSRREHKLTWEQFSQKLDVDLAELIGIENDENYMPAPKDSYEDRSIYPRTSGKVIRSFGTGTGARHSFPRSGSTICGSVTASRGTNI